MKIVKVALLLFFVNFSYGQAIKTLVAKRTKTPPKIDAILDDNAWENVPVATKFIEYRPVNGTPVSYDERTEVKFVYDDNFIYISAMMYDDDPISIPMEITPRDGYGQHDVFSIFLNPNNDKQVGFYFNVASTGVQADGIIDRGNFDDSWNSVWFNSTRIVENGWIVEIKIPYSSLRFPPQKIQTWGINFYRIIKYKNKELSWNYINNSKGFFNQYDGLLKGIENISPPIRLSFYPYLSTSALAYEGDFKENISLGMDMKYGITENFTLDITLVPDFGQTGFDKVTLNLSPFEQKYAEKRQFFTEGTSLFQKANTFSSNMFYSRRIGGIPIAKSNIEKISESDEIIENPNETNMINAIKISGRAKNGLGIGFLNAITDKAEATLSTDQDETYRVVTNPLTNYSMIVVDKIFNENSSISLVNTNVIRMGHFRDANATALAYTLRTPNDKYYIEGLLRNSVVFEDGNYIPGFNLITKIAKDSGNWNFISYYTLEDDKFDLNDMGFISQNNEKSLWSQVSYKILQPQGIFEFYKISYTFDIEYLYSPSRFVKNWMRLNAIFLTKDRLFFDAGIMYNSYGNDYFEARKPVSEEWVFIKKPSWSFSHSLSTDYRNKFAIDYEIWYRFYMMENQKRYSIKFSPRFRFSDALSVIYSFEMFKINDDIGYVKKQDEKVIFGNRNRNTFENKIELNYNPYVNNTLSISFRHIWTTVIYKDEYYNLNKNGILQVNDYKSNHDINYNSWNLDINYIWQINPGSQFLIFYRHNIFEKGDNPNLNFLENIGELFNYNSKHILSFKLTYFLDYVDIRKLWN